MHVLSLKQQAIALFQSCQLPEAKALYTRVCQIDKSDWEAWNMLGAIHGMLGEFTEAEACCREVIALQPGAVGTYNNLGNALKFQGKLEEAERYYREALRLMPDYADAYNNLGNLLREQHKLEEALACYKQGLRINPTYAEAYNNISIVLGEQNKWASAEEACRQALTFKPDYADAYNNLGNALQQQRKTHEAIQCYRMVVHLNPQLAEAYGNLGSALQDIGNFEQAVANYRQALRIKPDLIHACNDLAFCLNYGPAVDPAATFAEHVRCGQLYARGSAPMASHPNTPDPQRRLRIGYVSPDLHAAHPVASFFEPLLAAHDKSVVETFCYADVKSPDATTQRLNGLADHWRDIHSLADMRVADLIRRDAIDILVDLAGHTAGNRLSVFARKPAPVQITYLGYPNTTGLATIDYRLTDAWADPPGLTEPFHTETLVRLPHGFLCYRPPAHAPSVTPPPALTVQHVTFGSFNNLAKVTPEVIALWASILHAVPGSRLVLKYSFLADPAIRERYYTLLDHHGIARERVDLFDTLPAHADHLALYGRIDIGLDPFPYNGTTTTCEALWMGVPVITLAGRVHAGRVGVSLLSQVGLTECIAENPVQYLNIATALARDEERLAALRVSLRPRIAASSLCNANTFTRTVEAAYRRMWTTWCASSAQNDRLLQHQAKGTGTSDPS